MTLRLVPYGGSRRQHLVHRNTRAHHSTAPDLALTGSVTPAPIINFGDTGADPSTAGQNATFSVQVVGANPTGTVALEDADNGNAVLATAALSGGSATFSLSSLAPGNHDLIAAYSGDANNAATQSASLSHAVLFAATTTLTTTLAATVFGQSVTLTATVAGSSGSPTGTVEFLDGSTALGIVALGSGGAASLAVSNLAVGSHSITAVYSGDSNYADSTSSAQAETVNVAGTSTSAQSSEPIATVGDTVTLTALVAATSPGSGIPTGTVQFKVDGVNLGSPVPLNASGQASLSISTIAVGPHLVAAIYSGDSNFAGSTSVSISQAVDAVLQVTSVVVNGDHLSPVVSQQRSEVTSILYTFNQAVTLTSDSFQIAVSAGQTGTVPTLVVTPVAGSGNTEWLVTFTGAGVNTMTDSIGDGVYDITLVAAKVLASGARMTGNRVDTFYRLLGDLDGNGLVNIADFNTLVSSFLRPSTDPLYLPAADLDGDGAVGIADVSWMFVSNFLHSFTGFTATI